MSIEVRKVHRSANIIGVPVRNPEGEDLGQIEEVVIDLETGRVAYLVVSFGGFLGMGEKLVRHSVGSCLAQVWRSSQILRVAPRSGEAGKRTGVQQGRLARHGQSEMDG